MGSACCVAARDRTITNGSNSEIMVRNIRYSPSWSVRWDNRRRVAGEETSVSWFSDNIATNNRFLGNKSQTTAGTNYASEESSPLESFRNLTWQKSSPSEGFAGPQSDPSVSQITTEVKGTRETQITSKQSPTMMSSSSTHSVSSFSTSPLTFSQSQLLQPSRLKSPNLSISEDGSPFMLPGSHRRERWSFDSRCSNSNTDRVFFSPTNEMQTCGVCSKFLTEKSSFGGKKIISTNELAVVAILICGHVYHAECLENMTSEINKYDPACPVCTFGEKKVIKLSEKALRADLEMKSKMNRKSRSRVIDGEMNIDDIMFGSCKNSPKMSSSSSTSIKNSSGKPFLKRHFSFGSKGNRSLSENNFSRKKGFFWAKSSRE